LRVSDHDLGLIHDLATLHQLQFVPTAKGDLDHNLNQLRVAFARKKIRIHPRCKRLIYDLKNAIWKNQAKKVFAHSSDLGHFDTVAALIYLWRNVNQRRNPAPKAVLYERFDQQENRANNHAKPDQGRSKWHARGGRVWLK
jgi:anti-sigma factor ChrR (cupin superfamily)